MTENELKEKYPDVIWEKSYNKGIVLGYKKGDTNYSFVIKGSKMSAGDFTPETIEEYNNEIRLQLM